MKLSKSDKALEYLVENIAIERNDLCRVTSKKFNIACSTAKVLYYRALAISRDGRKICNEEPKKVEMYKGRPRQKFYFDDSRL